MNAEPDAIPWTDVRALFKHLKEKGVDDPDVDMFIAVFDNDSPALKAALTAGADVNITDKAVLAKYREMLLDFKPAPHRPPTEGQLAQLIKRADLEIGGKAGSVVEHFGRLAIDSGDPDDRDKFHSLIVQLLRVDVDDREAGDDHRGARSGGRLDVSGSDVQQPNVTVTVNRGGRHRISPKVSDSTNIADVALQALVSKRPEGFGQAAEEEVVTGADEDTRRRKVQHLKDKGVKDPNVDMFVAVYANDFVALKAALDAGADMNVNVYEVLAAHQSDLADFSDPSDFSGVADFDSA